jgi:radical SAM protein with 4Fe4S-binding SPASM domain
MEYPFFPFRISENDTGDRVVHSPYRQQDVTLNRSAAGMLELCNGSLSFDEIVAILAGRYQQPHVEIAGAAKKFLGRMEEQHLVWSRDEKMRWFDPPAPQSIFWEITSECNLRCLHCVVAAGKKLDRELSLERGLALIDEWAAMGVGDITFSGGEPLMHPELFTLARAAAGHGIRLQLATNGTLLRPDVVREIRELQMLPQVSLDGSNRELYGRFRGRKEAFDQAVEGIKMLVDAGVEVTVGTVVSTHNADDFEAMLDLVESLGVAAFRLIPFIPSGRGKKNRDLELPPDRVRDITKYLVEQRTCRPFEIIPMEFELTLHPPSGVQPDCSRPNECGGAVQYCTVTPSGEVLPCHYFDSVQADSVLEKSFAWIWGRSRFLNYFRSIRIGDIGGYCAQCCWLADCRGGCRAANFSIGAVLGENCHCWVAAEKENTGESTIPADRSTKSCT